jgi:hypothetical protein
LIDRIRLMVCAGVFFDGTVDFLKDVVMVILHTSDFVV